MALALLFAHLPGKGSRPRSSETPPATAGEQKPWGQLQITPIVIERPEEYFQMEVPPVQEISWYFSGMSGEQLAEYFRGLALPRNLESQLLDTNHWRVSGGGVIVKPSLDLVRDLPPEARANLYSVLGSHEANLVHRYPFVYRADGFDEWFANSGLPEEVLETIRRMTYVQKGRLCFSDSHYFRITLPPDQLQLLVRALSRVPTLLVTLKVNEGEDISRLLNYWGSPSRQRSLKPLLESMARAPGGASINISYFLPPLAQAWLYTYPHPTNRFLVRAPDCFWTSMNFARDRADDRFLNPDYIQTTLASEYHRVDQAGQFGDLILLYEPGQLWHAVHMCVYIADDIVFTKNGADIFQPWVLMRLADMMINYPSDKPLQTAVYRRHRRD